MPALPPSDDDSQLPKLRKFRFDSESAKVPREVPPGDSPGEQDVDLASTREISTSARPASGTAGGREDAPAMDDPSRLLADADRVLSRHEHAPHQRPTSAQRGPVAAAPSGPVATPRGRSEQADRRYAPPEPGLRPAGAAGQPLSGAAGTPVDTPPAKGPSTVPWLLAGLAAAVAIALVIWLIARPGSDDESTADGSAAPSDAGGGATVETAEWATGVCEQLSAYETAALPLKAEATQAASATGGAFSAEAAQDMQREAGELLAELVSTLGSLPAPADEEVAAVHDELVTTVSETAESTQASGNGAIGSPRDTATEVVGSLSVPVEAFMTATDELTDEQFAPIAETQACAGLL